MRSTIILIPARMGARRLPGKPLARIGGVPLIVHVWRRAVEAGCGAVAVATDSAEIVAAIEEAGGQALQTKGAHASGSDRVFEALREIDPEAKHGIVINLQGDMPFIPPAYIARLPALLEAGADIATLVAPMENPTDAENPNIVKAVCAHNAEGKEARALYFSRAAVPHGGPYYRHIGIYAYTRAALARFCALAPAPLERAERLEQLRALEAGMRIATARIDAAPASVDTPADLEALRREHDDQHDRA